MFTIFDTETSGLFDFSKPADAPGQPRLAQLAMIEVDDLFSEDFVSQAFYIQPNGWVMDAEASASNGLTTEFLSANGVDVAEALDSYERAIRSRRTLIAFNAQFDTKVMRAELRRAGRDDLFTMTKNICVMRPMMKFGVVKESGKTGYPRLEDCCRHIGHDLGQAHDALHDARGALALARFLQASGMLPEAKVHYAKNRPGDPAPAKPARKAKAPRKTSGGFFD